MVPERLAGRVTEEPKVTPADTPMPFWVVAVTPLPAIRCRGSAALFGTVPAARWAPSRLRQRRGDEAGRRESVAE